jgi:hypothetical protein
MDPHLVGRDDLDLLDPVGDQRGDDGVLGLARMVQRVGHVLGGEILAVMKLDALAQGDVESEVVGPAIALGEERLVGAGQRIVVDQRVAGEIGADHVLAQVLVIEIGGVDLVGGRPDQRVVVLARFGRKLRGEKDCGAEECGS